MENPWYDPGPSTYTGAPDECNVHWPTKLVGGECPECCCPVHPLQIMEYDGYALVCARCVVNDRESS